MRSLVIALIAIAAVAPGLRSKPAAPEQPLAFSHKIHAGTNKIGCQMCHAYAEHSTVAGIPSMARCIGCHRFIDKDKPDIKLLLQTYQKGKTLEWQRVYRVPDFVFFSHEPHVRSGIRCQTCHGEVDSMDVVQRASPLTMGWCVDCHRARQAPTDCLICHK